MSKRNAHSRKRKDTQSAAPGTKENPTIFKGTAASRSELLSNFAGYHPGHYVRVGSAIYEITGRYQECSGNYPYCYPARPIRC